MYNHNNPGESHGGGSSTTNQAKDPLVQGNASSDSTLYSSAWYRTAMYNPDSDSNSNPLNDAEALWEQEADFISQPTTYDGETASGRESLNVPVMNKLSSMRMAIRILEPEDDDNFSEEYELLGRLIRQIESGITAETPAEQNLGHGLTVFVPNAQLNSFSLDFDHFKMLHSLNHTAIVYDASEEEQNDEKQATIAPYETAEKQMALLREILANIPDAVDGRPNLVKIWLDSKGIKKFFFDPITESDADSMDVLYNLDYQTRMDCRQTVATIKLFNEAIGLYEQLITKLASISQYQDQLAQYRNGPSNKTAKKSLNKVISRLQDEVIDLNTRLNDLINKLC